MDIRIYRKNYDEQIQKNKILWKLFIQRSVSTIWLFGFLGSLILVLEWLTLEKGENFWKFETSFGLSVLLLSLFYFYHNYRNKIKYLSKAREHVNRYKNQDQGIEIRITDTLISYKDFESFSEMNWSIFSQYKIHSNYLLLIMDGFTLNSIIIDRNEVDEIEFNQLYEFVKTKLPERK